MIYSAVPVFITYERTNLRDGELIGLYIAISSYHYADSCIYVRG